MVKVEPGRLTQELCSRMGTDPRTDWGWRTELRVGRWRGGGSLRMQEGRCGVKRGVDKKELQEVLINPNAHSYHMDFYIIMTITVSFFFFVILVVGCQD